MDDLPQFNSDQLLFNKKTNMINSDLSFPTQLEVTAGSAALVSPAAPGGPRTDPSRSRVWLRPGPGCVLVLVLVLVSHRLLVAGKR